jgi:hypothetical protein
LRLSTFRDLFRVVPPLALALVALSGCDTSSSAAPTALDPPHLVIESIQSLGAPTWTPEITGGERDASLPCLMPGTDPDKTLSVNVGPSDKSGHLVSSSNPPILWTMAPPQACTGTPPCGFLVLTLDSCTSADPSSCGTGPSSEHAEIVSAAPSIPVLMKMFANPLGFYRFHVELKNQDATPAEDENGKRYPAEVVVEITEHCGSVVPPTPTDAGTPHRDGGSDAQVGPDTGPSGPTDSSVPVPDVSVPESGPPPSDATTRPDGAPASDARPPEPNDSAAPVGPADATSTG